MAVRAAARGVTDGEVEREQPGGVGYLADL
jgi:hypothetical protein